MAGRIVALTFMLVSWFGVARAEEPPIPPAPEAPAPDAPEAPPPTPAPAPPPVAMPPAPPPPVPTGPTIVTGRVTDVLGRNMVDVRVYVLRRGAKPQRTKTNKDGRYSVKVAAPGTHGVVIAIGKAHTFRTVIAKRGVSNTLDIETEIDLEGGEVITIQDKKRPKATVEPKPKQDTQKSLPYTDEAVERDAWARAWLLLDVDESGRVTRLKLLKKPGFGLERICLEEGFKLRFEPAKDHAGRPMKTYMLWTMEWPSWGWLVQGNGTAIRRPPDDRELHVYTQNHRTGVEGVEMTRGVETKIGGPWSRPLPTGTVFAHALGRVPCWGSGPLNLDLRNRAYRDCSKPDLALAQTLPWITRDTVATALEEMSAVELVLVEEAPKGSRLPGYIGVGVSAAMIVGTVVSFARFDMYHSRVVDHALIYTIDRKLIQRDQHLRDRWRKIALGMTAATVLVGGATLFLWNRNEPNFSLQPAPTGTGATAVYTTPF